MDFPHEACPLWWDREVDEQGHLIRLDVRRAAHALWLDAVKRVQRILVDDAEAAELMEESVLYISRHLNRAQVALFASNVPSLLSLHFSQRLRRVATRLGRITLVGDKTSIEECAVVDGWAERINRQVDLERVVCHLSARSRMILAMRIQEHDWELIAAKVGVSPSTLRRAFWKNLREAVSSIRGASGFARKERKK